MIAGNSAIDPQSMDEGTMRVAVATLLHSQWVNCLLTTHGTGCTLTFVGRGLRADRPLAALSANVSAWGLDGGGGHVSVVVSADRMCQSSVNDGGWDVIFPCKQVLGWRVDT